MAKEKGKRFRLKNLKRLLCCCCPFGKKTYTLDECDDGEDYLRGRFTPTWRVTNLDSSNGVAESLCRVDPSTISQIKPGERDEGHSDLLQVAKVFKQETLSRETGVMTEHAPVQLMEAQIMYRHQGEMNHHGRSVLWSFRYMMCQSAYFHRRIIQTFRNHCVIKYQIIFVSAYPDIFSLIVGSTFYVSTCSHRSYQVLRSLEYQCKNRSNNTSSDENDDEDNRPKSDADDDDERDNRALKQHNYEDKTCGNKADNGGSTIQGDLTNTNKDAIVVHNNVNLPNRLPKNDKQKKNSRQKYTSISKYCDYTSDMQYANGQMPVRSKRNGRIPVKSMLSAASDPPPNDLSEPAQAFASLSITETSILKSRSWPNMGDRHHHYLKSTSSSNSNKYLSSIYNNYQFIRGFCNQTCIGAILAVGFITLYFAYHLTYCSDSYTAKEERTRKLDKRELDSFIRHCQLLLIVQLSINRGNITSLSLSNTIEDK